MQDEYLEEDEGKNLIFIDPKATKIVNLRYEKAKGMKFFARL